MCQCQDLIEKKQEDKDKIESEESERHHFNPIHSNKKKRSLNNILRIKTTYNSSQTVHHRALFIVHNISLFTVGSQAAKFSFPIIKR